MDIEFINGETIDVKKVRELEIKLQVNLPDDYVNFIINNNGAYVFPNAFKVGSKIESINNFNDAKEISQFIHDKLPKQVIPIARDAGDNQICLDLRNPTATPILFWDYEIESIEDGALSFVADSLTEFFEMLFELEE